MLEAVSTVLYLVQHPTEVAAYERDALRSPKTIAAAKRAIPIFGELYGYFSANFTHIGHLYRAMNPIAEFTDRHDALEVNLGFLRIAAWLLYVVTELVFNELVKAPRYWHPVPNGFMFDPSPQERAWMASYLPLSDAP